MTLRTLALIPLLAVALSTSDSCIPSSKKGPPAPGPGDLVFEVKTVLPDLVDRPRMIEASGIFTASDSLIVQSPLEGVIEKVYVSEGDQVNAEDPLCVISADTINAEIEKKQAELKEAEASLEHDQKTLELMGETLPSQPQGSLNADDLFLDEEVPDRPVPEKPMGQINPPEPLDPKRKEDIVSKIKVTEATITRLNKELDSLEQQLENLTVKAPIGGMIAKRFVTEGSTAVKTAHLFEIVSLNPISLSLDIPQTVSSYVDKLVKVEAYPKGAPEMAAEGSVYFISPTLNTEKKTLEIRVHVPNPKGLIKGGQEGKAQISSRKIDKVLKIPQKAVVKRNDKMVIYVVNGNQAIETEVALKDKLDQDWVLVESNIRVDDPIIVSEQANIKDGSFVKIIPNPENSQQPEPAVEEKKKIEKGQKQVEPAAKNDKTQEKQ